MKRTLIAAATAVALAGGALATAIPATAAPAGIVDVRSQWQGQGQWHGGKGKGHGAPKWHARRACEPIIRWRQVGHHWRKHWQPVVVGWDCNSGRRHHKWGRY